MTTLPYATQTPPARGQGAGLGPMTRPDLVTRAFMRVVAFAEAWNRRYSKVGNPPVYDNATFPWVAAIEAATPDILAELGPIMARQSELPGFHELSPDVRTISTDKLWKTFFLSAYGKTSARAIAACPKTWAAVQKVPGLKTAMFSILEPGKHLPPHCGPYNGLLRLHLGLIVPQPEQKLGIRVMDRTCHWQVGKVLIFDDAYDHEAWNFTDETRVILFLDFVKPLRLPARFLNWLLLNLAVFTPFLREGEMNHAAWEKQFYGTAP